MQPIRIETKPQNTTFERPKSGTAFNKNKVFDGHLYKLKTMVVHLDRKETRIEFCKSLLALIFSFGIAWKSARVRSWWEQGTTGQKRELVYLRVAQSSTDLKTQKISFKNNDLKNTRILLEGAQFYLEKGGQKQPINLNDYQTYLLNDFRKLHPAEKIARCNNYQDFLDKIESAWKEKYPELSNDFVTTWKAELETQKKLAFQEEKTRNDTLVKQAKSKSFVMKETKTPPYASIIESETSNTVREIIPFAHLLGPGKEYKNPAAPIYQNIEALLRGEDLSQTFFVGVRGDGNCTLRAFSLGFLILTAAQGKEALQEAAKKLGLDLKLPAGGEIDKMLIRDFIDQEKMVDAKIILAIRQKIAEYYKANYKTDLEVRERVISSAAEKLQIDRKVDFFDPQSVSEEEIQEWLEAFSNPKDEQLSFSYVFANEKDLCTICQILECDLSYYGVSNVLATKFKRTKEGYLIIEKSSSVPATTSDGTPIQEVDKLGKKQNTQAKMLKIDYAREKVPSYSARHFQKGIESTKSSNAVLLFNRGGAHSDLLIGDK